MRVYISGRITGDPDYKRKFDEAEARLTIAGHKAVNPTEITPHHGKGATYADFMKADICALMLCDAIYMLDGWQESKGATLEKHIADVLGIEELK